MSFLISQIVGPIEIWIWSVLIFLSIFTIIGLIGDLFLPSKKSYNFREYTLDHPLLVVIIGPIIEEMAFRFPLLLILLKFDSNANLWIALIISCLIFILVHLSNLKETTMNPIYYLCDIGLMAVISSWLVIHYRSIFPAIVLHMINNFLAYLFNYMYYKKGDYYFD